MAQEINNFFPEIVHQPKDESKELWGIDYSKLSVIILKAMQEQQQQIELQQKEIQFLKGQILEINKK